MAYAIMNLEKESQNSKHGLNYLIISMYQLAIYRA